MGAGGLLTFANLKRVHDAAPGFGEIALGKI